MNEDQISTSFSTSSLPVAPDLNRLYKRENFLRQSIYDWPPFEFPGYKNAPSPKFRNEHELVQYLQSRTVEIATPPLHHAESFREDSPRRFAATITDIANDLIYGLECLARKGNNTATLGLHEISERSIFSVDRELERGNSCLKNKIRHAIRWPSFASSNSKFKRRVEAKLDEHGFGDKAPNKHKSASVADPAHQLVQALFEYMHDTRKKIESIEKELPLDSVASNLLSRPLLILRNLPLTLTKENVEEWHKTGIKLMQHEAKNENFWSHPAFSKKPLSDLMPSARGAEGTNMEQKIRNAWRLRASQD